MVAAGVALSAVCDRVQGLLSRVAWVTFRFRSGLVAYKKPLRSVFKLRAAGIGGIVRLLGALWCASPVIGTPTAEGNLKGWSWTTIFRRS